jgi:hypothetical protein
MHKILALLAFLILNPSAQAEHLVVLVPGFFNLPSVQPLPKYFGQTIVNTLREQGLTPIVLDNLNPIGSLSENGARVENDLIEIAAAHPGQSLDVIAHSAGGLYVAQALTRNPTLPLHHVITACTPYDGVKLVDLLDRIPGFKELTRFLNLQALSEFQSVHMPNLRAQLRIPNTVRWTALAAAQPVCNFITCAEASHQSWLLSMAWRFADEAGDGVVSVSSAEGRDVGWKMENWSGYVIPLEHWETVLDADWFSALGVADPSWIRQKQIEVYRQIAQGL